MRRAPALLASALMPGRETAAGDHFMTERENTMPGMDQLWQQKMLELGGEPLLALMKEIRDTQQQQAGQLNDLQRGINDLVRGFPAGDIDGHRRYHESVIEWRELRNQVMRAALEKVAQAGAIAAFGYLFMMLWEWFKVEVKK